MAIVDKIIILKNNHLVQSSFIVFIGSFIAGFGGYVYNVLMSRMLGPADYGILASLISLFCIISVPSGTLALVVSRSLAEFHARNQLKEARYFINKINWWFLNIGLAIFILFIFISSSIAGFLHISSIVPVVALGSVFGVSFIGSANNAGLQGLQRFSSLSINSILGSALKIIFGGFFVWMGWGVSGAVGAMTMSATVAIFYAYFSLKLPKKAIKTTVDLSGIISYAKPVFLATLCIAVFYNVDVILVKHFFQPEEAGHYSVLSLLGKIIFFITGSVPVVMFPAVVNRYSRNEKHSHILKYSFLLVVAGSLAITALYFAIPSFIVNLLFGGSYLSMAPYLGYFGLVMAIFSLINLLVVYNLSLRKTKFIPILLFGILLETALVCVFHNSIWQVITSMLAVMTLTFLALMVFQYGGRNNAELK